MTTSDTRDYIAILRHSHGNGAGSTLLGLSICVELLHCEFERQSGFLESLREHQSSCDSQS